MKLHILNDLHIEFENFEPPATGADVVVLAGSSCAVTCNKVFQKYYR